MRRATHSRKGFPIPWASIVLVLLCIVGAYFYKGAAQTANAPAASNISAVQKNALSVYFLDVGQGDSELIRLPDGKNVLIDAGTTATADDLAKYLKEIGISELNYVIATHPHEDHIGGMTKVLQTYKVDKLYLPKVADSQTPTTRTYENLLDAAADKGLKLTQGKAGMTVFDENGIKMEFLAPNGTSYKEMNNYSIVAKLTYGERSFLFTGDAEAESEKEMRGAGFSLHADVLKCGHHGSSTSTTAAFLKAVSPKYAIISCGADNDYGHPHREVLDRLQKAGVQIYRTDKNQTVLAICDGKSITFQTDLKSIVK